MLRSPAPHHTACQHHDVTRHKLSGPTGAAGGLARALRDRDDRGVHSSGRLRLRHRRRRGGLRLLLARGRARGRGRPRVRVLVRDGGGQRGSGQRHGVGSIGGRRTLLRVDGRARGGRCSRGWRRTPCRLRGGSQQPDRGRGRRGAGRSGLLQQRRGRRRQRQRLARDGGGRPRSGGRAPERELRAAHKQLGRRRCAEATRRHEPARASGKTRARGQVARAREREQQSTTQEESAHTPERVRGSTLCSLKTLRNVRFCGFLTFGVACFAYTQAASGSAIVRSY